MLWWKLKECTVQHGCCFLVWGRVRNYSAQCLQSQWLIPDDLRGLHKPFELLENDLPASTEWCTTFLSKVCRCLRKQFPSVLLSLAYEPPLMNFNKLHHLKKSSTDENDTLREEMASCAFTLLRLMPMRFQDWTVITCFPFCHSWFQFPSYPSQGFWWLLWILWRVSYFGKKIVW